MSAYYALYGICTRYPLFGINTGYLNFGITKPMASIMMPITPTMMIMMIVIMIAIARQPVSETADRLLARADPLSQTYCEMTRTARRRRMRWPNSSRALATTSTTSSIHPAASLRCFSKGRPSTGRRCGLRIVAVEHLLARCVHPPSRTFGRATTKGLRNRPVASFNSRSDHPALRRSELRRRAGEWDRNSSRNARHPTCSRFASQV